MPLSTFIFAFIYGVWEGGHTPMEVRGQLYQSHCSPSIMGGLRNQTQAWQQVLYPLSIPMPPAAILWMEGPNQHLSSDEWTELFSVQMLYKWEGHPVFNNRYVVSTALIRNWPISNVSEWNSSVTELFLSPRSSYQLVCSLLLLLGVFLWYP